MTRQSLIFVFLLISVAVYAPGHSLERAGQASLFSKSATSLASAGALKIPLSSLTTLGAGPFGAWPAVPGTRHGGAVPIDTLAQQLSLPLVQVGSHLYWLSPPRHLRGIFPTPNAVRFELSGFVPLDLQRGANALELTFHNTLTLLPDQRWPWHNAWLAGVQTTKDPVKRQVRVRLALRSPASYRLVRPWSNGANVVEVQVRKPAVNATLPEASGPFQYRAQRVMTAAGETTVHVVSVPRVTDRYHLVPLIPPDGLGRLLPLSQLVKRGGVALAINANFFDPNSRMPIGLLIQNSRLERVDHAGRGALGVDLFGKLHFWHPQAQGWVNVAGQRLELDGINRPPRADELVLISSAYGLPVRLPEAATVVRVHERFVRAVTQTTAFDPDRQSDYLIATGSAQVRLGRVQPNAPAAFGYTLVPAAPVPIRSAWGAGPVLVQGGQVVLNAAAESFDRVFATGRAARSAIGLAADGTLLLVVVAQDQDNAGMTLAELAGWMQAQGASSALALDGGGSASLSFRQGVRWHHLGGTRPVAVGLGLVPR